MPSPATTYSFSNASVADATQVNQNFTDIINGITDGTKDLSISALTAAGNVSFTGSSITLGNASSDDLTITASLASTINIKTTNSYNIGSSTLGLAGIYLGANSQTVRIVGSGSMSATWTLTLPTTAGTADYFLQTNGSGVSSWTQVTADLVKGTTSGSSAPAGFIGEMIQSGTITDTTTVNALTLYTVTGASITLTAGNWIIFVNASMYYNNLAGSASIAGGIQLWTSSPSSAYVPGGTSTYRNGNADNTSGFGWNAIMTIPVNITQSTTYVLKIWSVAAAAGGPVTLLQADQSFAEDQDAIFYAIRIR
jgi:hypothetical protein